MQMQIRLIYSYSKTLTTPPTRMTTSWHLHSGQFNKKKHWWIHQWNGMVGQIEKDFTFQEYDVTENKEIGNIRASIIIVLLVLHISLKQYKYPNLNHVDAQIIYFSPT